MFTTGTRFCTSDIVARRWRTGVQLAAWICMGLYSEVTGPTLPYLRRRVMSNYEEVSRALVARSVGFFAGALLGGVLCHRLGRHADLWLALSLVIPAISAACVPWCRTLWILGLLLALDGLGKGVLASVGNTFILLMWGEKAAVPSNAIHFCFGIGALVVPQICEPFLPEVPHHTSNITHDVLLDGINGTTGDKTYTNIITQQALLDGTNGSTRDYTTTDNVTDLIEYPYIIVASITFAVGLLYFVLYCVLGVPKCVNSSKRNDDDNVENNSEPAKLVKWKKYTMVVVLCIFWAIQCGMERAYGKFIFAFVVESSLQFSPSNAAWLESAFWLGFLLGRMAAIFAVWKMAPHKFTLIVLVLCLATTVTMSVMSDKNDIVIWVGTTMLGASISPLFATMLAWANFYMDTAIIAWIVSAAFISMAAGAFVFSWLAGYLFQYAGLSSLLYLMFGSAVVIMVLFIVLMVLTKEKFGGSCLKKKEVTITKEEIKEAQVPLTRPL